MSRVEGKGRSKLQIIPTLALRGKKEIIRAGVEGKGKQSISKPQLRGIGGTNYTHVRVGWKVRGKLYKNHS